MNRFDRQWRMLIAPARRSVDPRAATAPAGFALRVAAQALALPPTSPWAAFEQLALRGLVVALLLGAAAIAFDYPAFLPDQTEEYTGYDPVGEVLDPV